MRLTRKIAEQLNAWAAAGTEATDTVIKRSDFYQATQTAIELNASRSGLTPDGAILLAHIVALSPTLTTLDISHNDIGGGAAALAPYIAASKLTTLDISHNRLKDHAADFGPYIAASKLTTLYMGDNAIGGRVVVRALGPHIAASKLTTLDLSHNDIGGPAAAALGPHIVASKLTTLDISNT